MRPFANKTHWLPTSCFVNARVSGLGVSVSATRALDTKLIEELTLSLEHKRDRFANCTILPRPGYMLHSKTYKDVMGM